MSIELLLQLASVAVAGVSAIVACIQAKAAWRSREEARDSQKLAEEAQVKALEYSARAADASERLASAQEDAVKLAREVGPGFKLVPLGGYYQRLINVGNATLCGALLRGEGGKAPSMDGAFEGSPLAIPDEYPRDIHPGQYIDFIAQWSALGRVRVTLTGSWNRDGKQVGWGESWVFDHESWL